MDFMSFMLGVTLAMLIIIATAEIYGMKKAKNDHVSKAQKCMDLYSSTSNIEFLKEAKIQLSMAIHRKEVEEGKWQD